MLCTVTLSSYRWWAFYAHVHTRHYITYNSHTVGRSDKIICRFVLQDIASASPIPWYRMLKKVSMGTEGTYIPLLHPHPHHLLFPHPLTLVFGGWGDFPSLFIISALICFFSLLSSSYVKSGYAKSRLSLPPPPPPSSSLPFLPCIFIARKHAALSSSLADSAWTRACCTCRHRFPWGRKASVSTATAPRCGTGRPGAFPPGGSTRCRRRGTTWGRR